MHNSYCLLLSISVTWINISGDLGPVYGMQWRHSGAQYVDSKTDYTGQGIDQLQNIIQTIKYVVKQPMTWGIIYMTPENTTKEF